MMCLSVSRLKIASWVLLFSGVCVGTSARVAVGQSAGTGVINVKDSDLLKTTVIRRLAHVQRRLHRTAVLKPERSDARKCIAAAGKVGVPHTDSRKC